MSTRLRLTVAEYDAMIERGAFEHLWYKHIELINGELRQKPAPTPHEAHIISEVNRWASQSLRSMEVDVRPRLPLSFDPLDSEPEPDLALAVDRSYHAKHPLADDVYLVIEVADVTLEDDLGMKALLYARAGINDYWVVDIPHRLVHVFRQPSASGYLVHEEHASGQVRPLAFPDIGLPLEELFAE